MIVKVLLLSCLCLFYRNVFLSIREENSKYRQATCIVTMNRIDEYNCSCHIQYSGYVTYNVSDYGSTEIEVTRSQYKGYIENLLLKDYALNSKVDCFVSRNLSDTRNVKFYKVDENLLIPIFTLTLFFSIILN
jgi:hypothetical protein